MIGLSGLITPSLDEMVEVASEMSNQGFKIPLLIGGATTSKKHTVIKIDPVYKDNVFHVLDASKSVFVSQNLLKENNESYKKEIKTEYKKVKDKYYNNKSSKLISLDESQKNKFEFDWSNYNPVKPSFEGVKYFEDILVEDIIDYIDWTPFFNAWGFKKSYPKILNDKKMGEEAKKLFKDANEFLDLAVKEKLFNPKATIGFFEATSIGDDIILKNGITLNHLRQQTNKGSRKNYCLSDFIAPQDYNIKDWIGAFAVTAGTNVDIISNEKSKQNNDYESIMIKVIGDRIAEALAEKMHKDVRKKLWGYSSEENLNNLDLIKEKYIGIRPAPGYPACPDHSEKEKIWKLLDIKNNSKMKLTESYAVSPASSVTGWYFSHPKSKYFSISQISNDQLKNYAKRKGANEEIFKKIFPHILEL